MKTERNKMEKNKPGVGVGIMVLNNKGEVLLGRRNEDPKKADSLLHGEGMWTLPGGKLDFGESLEQCAAREVLEETGIKAGKLEMISVTNDMTQDAHFITIGFLCRRFEDDPKVMEPNEITEWRWFPLDRRPEPVFPPSLKMINNYKNKRIFGE